MTTKLRAIDRDAMRRAIEIVRRENFTRREQIDEKLTREPWEEVGAFASYAAQCTALKLKPWQAPPCYTRGFTDNPSNSYGNRPDEMKLRDDLLGCPLERVRTRPRGAVLAAKMT